MSGPRAVILFGLLATASGLAYALTRSAKNGPVDGINWDSLPYDFLDTAEAIVNTVTEKQSTEAPDVAASNIAAFLAALRASEGTDREPDPYRVVMGYGVTLQDLSDHPYFTGEWAGAAFGEGQWSTAAGAYQFVRRTWASLRDKLQLQDFGPASQDAAAIELIREKGALEDVKAGRFSEAVTKVRRIWASLPGAGYGQGERSIAWLQQVYSINGGAIA